MLYEKYFISSQYILYNQYIKNIILNIEYFVQQNDRALKPMNILKFYFILHRYKFIFKKKRKKYQDFNN